MALALTLSEIANRTLFSEAVPESARLLIFSAAFIASAVVLRKIFARMDERRSVAVAKEQVRGS